MRNLVAVTALQSFLDPRWIDFDAEKHGTVHRRSEWLGAAHSAKSAGQDKFSFKRATKMFSSRRGVTIAHTHIVRPDCARPARPRHKQSVDPDFLRRPDRDCSSAFAWRPPDASLCNSVHCRAAH